MKKIYSLVLLSAVFYSCASLASSLASSAVVNKHKQKRKIASVYNYTACKITKLSKAAGTESDIITVEKSVVAMDFDQTNESANEVYAGSMAKSGLLPSYSLNLKYTLFASGETALSINVKHNSADLVSQSTVLSNSHGVELHTAAVVNFKSADGKQFNISCATPTEEFQQ